MKQEKPQDKGGKDKDDGGKKMMSEKEAFSALKNQTAISAKCDG